MKEKITLPQELQKQMLKFFLKTSIPRIKQEKINSLSEQKTDRSNKE
jgi:cell division FtsZ-interacting protein ZapD